MHPMTTSKIIHEASHKNPPIAISNPGCLLGFTYILTLPGVIH
jgi:hypothetical protein